MKPIYFELSNELHLMIIPDTQAHLDGHLVITYNYNIFRYNGQSPELITNKSPLFKDLNNNPDYYGYITFEEPGKLFTYTSNDSLELTPDEVTELIELLSHMRDTPRLWDQSGIM